MKATVCFLLLLFSGHAALPSGVPICFNLPKREGIVRATVAITDPHDDKWLVATVSGGAIFNTSASHGIHDKGCVYWDGLDDNWWPVPPGQYGVKGILMNASIWEFDGKPHTLIPEFDGAISPFTRTKDQNNRTISAFDLHRVVGGDPVGTSFSSVGTNVNFPQRRPRANFYHHYLENDCNNYLIALDRPQGPSQLVSKWPDAGIQGGKQTSTDGQAIWSSFAVYKTAKHFLYRADTPAAGQDPVVSRWGHANHSQFIVYPGLVELDGITTVRKLEAAPGRNITDATTIVWALLADDNSDLPNSTHLRAYDGYDPDAPVLWSMSPANYSSFSVRNGTLTLLTAEGLGYRLALNPRTGLPISTTNTSKATPSEAQSTTTPESWFNLTQLFILATNHSHWSAPPAPGYGPIVVDANGSAYVYDPHYKRIVAVTKDGELRPPLTTRKSRSQFFYFPGYTNLVGPVTDAFDGVASMAIWMDSLTDTERLIVLETGATNRFIEYSLANGSTTRIWNGIQAGSNDGWVFDPFNTSFGWVVHSRPRGDFEEYKEDGPPFRHARGDLIKFQLDANDYGDFEQVEVFSGLCTPFRIGDLCAESSTTIGHCGECGYPAFVQLKGHTYLVFQHLDKVVFKYNASAKHPKDMFRPSAGFVSLYTNNTVGSKKIDKVLWAWHDADNSGSWLLPDGTPDFAELGAPVPEGIGVGGIKGWGMLGHDRVQDDLSFVGPSKMGFWIWDVVGFDAFDNPIYDPKGARILLNDSIIQSRYLYNDSAIHPSPNPCPSCKGLPQIHGGNEIAGEVDMRSAGVFVDSTHENFVAALGHAGSQWTGGFSADSAPQYKLAWYAKDESAKTGWRNVWRTGKVALRGITGQQQFAGPSMVGEDETVQATIAHKPIGNVLAVTDEMRAAFTVYTTEGLFVDSVFASSGPLTKGQGYRKNFSFFSRGKIMHLSGEYFGVGQTHLDPTTSKVHIATGKTTVESFTLRGWTGEGVATERIVFDSDMVDLSQKDIAVPMDIAQQLRGLPPSSYHREVPLTLSPPALDGSLDAIWNKSAPTRFVVDGLNVDGPALIDARMMHDGNATVYVRISVNQTLTDWPIVPRALDPANRMFVHSRAATTCSLYLRTNISAFMASPPHSRRAGGGKGVLGDVRLVFGVFVDQNSKPDLKVLGIYPYWDDEWGNAAPATYAAGGTGTITLDNVALLDLQEYGYKLSEDRFFLEMAAAIPIAKYLPMLPRLGGNFLTNGDFSCNIQGFQKVWAWNVDLKASEIVWDEPTEAQIWSNSWGNISFTN